MKRKPLFILCFAFLLLGAAVGNIRWTQLRSGDRHGTQAQGQSSDGTGVSGNCAKFNADGSVTDSGLVCTAATGGTGLVLVEEHTASASAALNFTSCITSSYDTYMLVASGITTSANTIIGWQMSTNGGSTYDTGNNYQYGFVFGYSGGSGGTGATAVSSIQWRDVNTTLPAGGSYNGTFTLYVIPGGTLNTTMTGNITMQIGAGVSVLAEAMNGMYFGATGVNAFRLIPASGTLTVGTVRCYGISK